MIGSTAKVDIISIVKYEINVNFILVDECNRKFGYESPKVIINVIS